MNRKVSNSSKLIVTCYCMPVCPYEQSESCVYRVGISQRTSFWDASMSWGVDVELWKKERVAEEREKDGRKWDEDDDDDEH